MHSLYYGFGLTNGVTVKERGCVLEVLKVLDLGGGQFWLCY